MSRSNREPGAPLYDDHDKGNASRSWKNLFQIESNGTVYTVKHDGPGRYHHPSCLDDDACFQTRETTIAIFQGDQYIGFLEFHCYKFADNFSPKLFAWEMDAIDGDTYELGLVLGSCWSRRDLKKIVSSGYLLEFHRVWIRPEFRPCFVWADVADHVINTIFRRHSIMLLCAAPMELQDQRRSNRPGVYRELTDEELTQDQAHRAREERHRQHMIQAYKRLLGVESLPGPYAEDGWMWKPRESLRGRISLPRFKQPIDPYD